MKKIAFKTLGCKLNQAETEGWIRICRNRGFIIVKASDHPDIMVIHTCTVTNKSASKCRQSIRQAVQQSADAVVIAAGCYAQVEPESVARIKGIDYILGTQDKHSFFSSFTKLEKQKHPVILRQDLSAVNTALTQSGDFQKQTRAFIKIQDGCNNFCSYCIVPYARGRCRSVHEDQILKEAARLLESGFKEIVLTGVHVGDYGKDKTGVSLLPELISKIASLGPHFRLRLSSLNCGDITDKLIETVVKYPNICRHFHIPLQSGSEAVLKSMNRNYTPAQYKSAVEKLTGVFNNPGLGTDIIAGFPGETGALFEETKAFVESLPFSYFHVFPFSSRKGTSAENMQGHVEAAEKARRAAVLREIGMAKKKLFMSKWMNREVEVLFEDKIRGGRVSGYSSEYLRVETAYKKDLPNKLVLVNIEQINKDTAFGKALHKTDP